MLDSQVFELIIDEEDQLNGIEAISIVENPAIQENFIALSEDKVKLAQVDEEKKILLGAALIPNKKILRKDKDGNPYYIFFSEKTVRLASQIYQTRANQNNTTLEHEVKLNGLSVVETWIVEDEVHDKSRKYNLSVPVGTWMVAMKVNNPVIWNEFVKTGMVKGFSIEGKFADAIEMSSAEKEATKLLEKLLNKLNS